MTRVGKASGSYLTDDEAWRDHERMEMVAQARKDVTLMARAMLSGKDLGRISSLMGVTRGTLSSKVREARFTAVEFVVLAYLCGFEVDVEDQCQMRMNALLEDDLK